MAMRRVWAALTWVLLAAGGARAAEPAAPGAPGGAGRCQDQAMLTMLDTAMQGLSGKPARLLALSGGGQHGAFGAGFLRGWRTSTATPARPDPFEMVSGTSAGALIAPFAFLGTKEDDDRIVQEYAAITRDADVYSNRFFLTRFWKDSLTTRDQFRRRLSEKAITTDMVRRVAVEGRKGRRLLVGAVDMESGCFHYFDLTALSDRAADADAAPKEVEQIRQDFIDRLMASTAIPVQFPPVLIKEKGQALPAIYADGGVRRNLFVEPLAMAAAKHSVALDVFVIFNGERGVERETREKLFGGLKLLNMAGRTVSMLLDESTEGNLFRVYLQVERLKQANAGLHTDVYFTSIPPAMSTKCNALGKNEDKNFSNDVIKCLIKEGEAMGAAGGAWSRDPLAPIE
jgi:predicted acylesterase/phospholipase RssA